MGEPLQRGRRLGVDVGMARVGIARSDPDGVLATPVESIPVTGDEEAGLARAAELARDCAVVYVGLPLHMGGQEGASARYAQQWAALLADRVPAPVRLVDERLSTVEAHRRLRSSGRSTRRHRPVVDQEAAVIILQGALESERDRGVRAGRSVA